MQALPSDMIRMVLKDTPGMIFRILINPLAQADIMRRSAAPIKAGYVELNELHAESEEMVGDSIAAQGIAFLKTINQSRAFSSSDLASAAE